MPKIAEMFAFIVQDTGPDDEGVVAFLSKNNEWMPMVGADPARAQSLRGMATHIAKERGKTVRLVRFKVREEVERFDP